MTTQYSYTHKTFFYKTDYTKINNMRPLTSTSKQIKLYPLSLKKNDDTVAIAYWHNMYHREINYIFGSLVRFYIAHKIYFNDKLDNIYNAFVELLYEQYTNKL